jgi:hypothetical protein
METVSQLPLEDQRRLRAALALVWQKEQHSIIGEPMSKQRKNTKLEHQGHDEIYASSASSVRAVDNIEFMKPQHQNVVEQCITKFIDCTGNLAVATAICMVCGREVRKDEADTLSVCDIPHWQLLVPIRVYFAHLLTEGMLLQSSAMTETSIGRKGSVCRDCMSNLTKNWLPRLALANGMWIGDVPEELAVLTLPETILIAQHFPAAHIVKLFPASKGAPLVNCALQGNVSTYRLDADEIADMVQGNIMPNPSKVLASTIGVTIIGPKNVQEKTLPGFLWLRRKHVQDALVWLKANNPLYADIVISFERLEQIMENGIPHEVLHAIWHSDDINKLECERAGYVPEDDQFVNEANGQCEKEVDHTGGLGGTICIFARSTNE